MTIIIGLIREQYLPNVIPVHHFQDIQLLIDEIAKQMKRNPHKS